MITENHKQCKHLGIQATINRIRLSGFGIPKVRQAAKRLISQCTICQKFNNLAFKYPKVTNFSKSRINLIKSYLHTEIDYTGHVWVKGDRGVCKMYLLIFTCLNIRAIHVVYEHSLIYSGLHQIYKHVWYTLTLLLKFTLVRTS